MFKNFVNLASAGCFKNLISMSKLRLKCFLCTGIIVYNNGGL